MRKRFMSAVAAAAMLFGCIPISVSAEKNTSLYTSDGRVEMFAHDTARKIRDLTAEGSISWNVPGETKFSVTVKNIQSKRNENKTAVSVDSNINDMAENGVKIGVKNRNKQAFKIFTADRSGILTKLGLALDIQRNYDENPGDLNVSVYKADSNNAPSGKALYETTLTRNDAGGSVNLINLNLSIPVTEGENYAVVMTPSISDRESWDALYVWLYGYNDASGLSGVLNDHGIYEYSSIDEQYGMSVEITPTESDGSSESAVRDITIDAGYYETYKDFKTSFAWSDGYPTRHGYDTSGIIMKASEQDDETCFGYSVSVPKSESERILTYTTAISAASAKTELFLDGEDTPALTSEALKNTIGKADDFYEKTYSLTIPANSAAELKVTADNIFDSNAALTLGAVSLSDSKTISAKLRSLIKDSEAFLEENQKSVLNVNTDISLFENLKDKISRIYDNDIDAFTGISGAYTAAKFSVQNVRSNMTRSIKEYVTSIIGWEGDVNAPHVSLDGSIDIYKGTVGQDMTVIPGVFASRLEDISWYNAEGYLPCLVSEFSKGDVNYKVEDFANLSTVNGNDYEIAYMRVTVDNNSDYKFSAPNTQGGAVPINKNAKELPLIEPHTSVSYDYAVMADTFGKDIPALTEADIQNAPSFDEAYAEMREYWNSRLDGIVQINDLPSGYEVLSDAYRAGYIYTMIVKDYYGLHVGEQNYDRVFDHDIIGILSTLVILGDCKDFDKYAEHILDNPQYPDTYWKYSWPYALYLNRTGDTEYIASVFDKIKSSTHDIEASLRDVALTKYGQSIMTSDGKAAMVMRSTNAIDSDGYWLIDCWSSLTGLTTYKYICDIMYASSQNEEYKNEAEWVSKLYDFLLESTDLYIQKVVEDYGINYLPVSTVEANSENRCKDPRDANWAAHFLFGRWAWDGYLFGANQESNMLGMIDSTYDFNLNALKDLGYPDYTYGGYPGLSTGYNAGYASAALRGEKYRDWGIKSYMYMIENTMSGPFSWWENITDKEYAGWNNGGGSCPHMWGQSVNTKVLLDSVISVKSDGGLIIGRGIPDEWISDGEKISLSNISISGGDRISLDIETEGEALSVKISGNTKDIPMSIEIPYFKNNIKAVSGGTFDSAAGTVSSPAGITEVKITLEKAYSENVPFRDVDDGKWYYDDIKYVFKNGLMLGTEENIKFEPETKMTRAMFITALGRACGAEENTDFSFTDTVSDEWYSGYLGWAVNGGLILGFPDGSFRPDAPMTREQMAAIISRFLDCLSYDKSPALIGKFADRADIADWAYDSVEKIRHLGIVQGGSMGRFYPTDTLTRAEAAAIIRRINENYISK